MLIYYRFIKIQGNGIFNTREWHFNTWEWHLNTREWHFNTREWYFNTREWHFKVYLANFTDFSALQILSDSESGTFFT